jgi:hypothetical protein
MGEGCLRRGLLARDATDFVTFPRFVMIVHTGAGRVAPAVETVYLSALAALLAVRLGAFPSFSLGTPGLPLRGARCPLVDAMPQAAHRGEIAEKSRETRAALDCPERRT